MIFDFLCTYHLIDDKEDSNLLYKIQLLQAFNLYNYNEFDDEKIQYEISKLFNKYKDNNQIKNILDNLKIKHNLFFDNNLLFIILFSYDYFYIFFSCLKDLETNDYIINENYNKLINIIN